MNWEDRIFEILHNALGVAIAVCLLMAVVMMIVGFVKCGTP